MCKINIAIDGFSSCGKSTLAKQLAEKLNYVFVDTGAMYRAAALYFLRNDLAISDTSYEQNSAALQIAQKAKDGVTVTLLNGEEVSVEIRQPEVNAIVSDIAKIHGLRVYLGEVQQDIARNKGVVMEGRDIGTNILPDAELKIFLTASKEVRTERRWLEFQKNGVEISKQEVEENLAERDYKDTHRSENPLVQAEDARVLDNTELNPEEQLALVQSWVAQIIDEA